MIYNTDKEAPKEQPIETPKEPVKRPEPMEPIKWPQPEFIPETKEPPAGTPLWD
jgi:hypothetical protein